MHDHPRPEFDAAILKYVEKSIAITRELIAECDLKPGDIEKVLLVGGSTFVPLVQSQVEALGIPVDRSMDPMTVVAHGAAVFAGSQRMPKAMRAAEPVKAGAARVELEYEPTGKDLEPPVVGKVSVDGGQPPAGTTVELKRTDEGWTSGQTRVGRARGSSRRRCVLREKGKSEFAIEVRDAGGNVPWRARRRSFSMQYGMSVAKATLPSGIQVALADGSVRT